MILLVRADDRLIHGMVAVSWASHLQPETILVANDAAAVDEFKVMTMKMAKPAGVKLIVKTVENAIKALNNPINDNKKIFLVTENVEDAYRVFQNVKGTSKFNLGTAGIVKKPNEEYVATLPQVFTSKEEFEFARKMHDAGVEVFAQVTPTRERMEFSEIEKIFNK